jgi:hypothetical protein
MSHMVCQIVVRLAAALLLFAIVEGGAMAAEAAKPGTPPVAKKLVPPEQIDRLVKQLGDRDYYVRQRAQEDLSRLGFGAFDALTAATTNDDLEIASRAKYLLRLMRVEWTAENDPPEVKTLLHGYEFEDERSREGKMTSLAALPDGVGANALCRLVRFENSARLSKAAAIALLGIQSIAQPPKAPVAAVVRKTLGGCRRPGAVWLLAWVRLAAEPAAVMDEWGKLTDHERELLGRAPVETSQEIVAGLTRLQVA